MIQKTGNTELTSTVGLTWMEKGRLGWLSSGAGEEVSPTHPFGRYAEVVWDTKEGGRPTSSLGGELTGSGPKPPGTTRTGLEEARNQTLLATAISTTERQGRDDSQLALLWPFMAFPPILRAHWTARQTTRGWWWIKGLGGPPPRSRLCSSC
jgi:hypothetical protein